MSIDFDTCFERLLGHEGKFQNDYHDRGNWTTGVIGQGDRNGTKWGISAMSYPHLDIASLSKEDAKELYRVDFWDRVRGDDLHAAIAYQLFDAAVNHGINTAIRLLQRALDVADDAIFGPTTASMANLKNVDDTLHKFNAERLEYYTKLNGWPTYGRGWVRRVVKNMRYAAHDYSSPWYENLEV